jgi:rod shape-determining protein MreD
VKKLGIGVIFFIVFLIIFYLQANIFPLITIGGILPNLFVIFVLFIGLFTNSKFGVVFGVIFGIVIDCVYSKCIGITAIMLCIVGYLGAYFDKNFSKESKITIILMVAGSTLIYEFGWFLLNSIIIGFDIEWLYLLKISIIETIYNVLLTIILYPLIQKMGYKIDRIFKRNNVLTRYF